jgi:hypothetical protein
MPLKDALVLVAKEFKRSFTKQGTGISQRAAELVDDFLAWDSLASYSEPSCIQYFLVLLVEGRDLYKAEPSLITNYLKAMKDQVQGIWHCPLSFSIVNLNSSLETHV